jgi:hypothetical protein
MLREFVYSLQEETGWSDATLLELILDFYEQTEHEYIADYLQAIANGETDDSDR